MSMTRRLQEAKRRRAVASATPSPARIAIRSPEDVEINSRMEQAVLAMRDDERPTNTLKAIGSKTKECMQRCDHVYPSDRYRCTLDREKACRFMWFVAFREQKPRGGNKKTLQANTFFNPTDCDDVCNEARNFSLERPDPKKSVGPSTFGQCKAALRGLYKEQLARRAIDNHWDAIWTEAFEELEKHVKDRAPMKKKLSCEEKATGEFAPYAIAERHGEIEEALWGSRNSAMNRSVNTALRHRFCFLHLTSGILQCESLCRAELSDFLGLKVPKKDKDVHPMFLMTNQIAIGKTTHGRVQHGRATRHKDVRLCATGSLASCLMCRFYNTREFHDFTVEDWLDRRTWFDIKLLTDLIGDSMSPMHNDSHGDKLKAILRALGLPSCDLLHLGRKLGSKTLDLLEEESREMKRMGQWADGVWDGSYSSKLPFGPIRKLAGYASHKEFYFNTRTMVEPDEALLRHTPIGEWVCDAMEGVNQVAMETGKHGTAAQVLRFFSELNNFFLQDAAATMVLHPERSTHVMCGEFVVFQSDQFKAHKEQMGVALRHESNPLDANLESMLPGVHRWHSATNTSIETLGGKFDTLKAKVVAARDGAKRASADERRATEHRIATSFMDMARSLLGGDTGHKFGVREENLNACLSTQNEPVREPEAASEEAAIESSCNPEHRCFRMTPKHKNVSEMLDEWHGRGRFSDSHGGIAGRDEKHKAKWRKHLDQQHHSRTKRCIYAIKAYAALNKLPIEEAVGQLQGVCEQIGHSVSNVVRHMQSAGILVKNKARGKKAIAMASVVNN